MNMIEVKNLNFDYPGKRVLHDVSFGIAEGSVTALVGPNGAGKTTLLRCLVALDRPHSGEIFVGGIDVTENPRAVHRQIGYLSDFFGLFNDLTVRQCLTYMCWSQQVDVKNAAERVDVKNAAERVQIKNVAQHVEKIAREVMIDNMLERKAGVLSRGYRQRLGIGLALVHDPALIILDEPASGMDPEARIQLSQLMRALRARGKTMIVSSHILNELEDYCTDMLIIRDGRVAGHVLLSDHTQKTQRIITISLRGGAAVHADKLSAQKGLTVERLEGDAALCRFDGDEVAQQALLAALLAAGLPIYNFASEQHSLQDAYMRATETEAPISGGQGA
ncbi:MAG: ABC transporter ATP-binding protein [Alphaproteobacteria bacterium]|nr:ABC transporter ATP-binding protein [Alphaproteobacteria bacterium]